MTTFNKQTALSIIEDALTEIETQHGCGIATGLCGAFYMCGMISKKEWQSILERIPPPRLEASSPQQPPGVSARGAS